MMLRGPQQPKLPTVFSYEGSVSGLGAHSLHLLPFPSTGLSSLDSLPEQYILITMPTTVQTTHPLLQPYWAVLGQLLRGADLGLEWALGPTRC